MIKDFLERVAELNPQLKHTQFADYHGHGWVFRAVFKHDRKGNLLDLDDNKIDNRRSAEIRESGSPEGRASRARHAMRRLPFRCRCARQRHALRRTAQRDRDHLRRLSRHRRPAPDADHSGNAGQIDLLNTSNTPFGPRFIWEGNKLWQQSTMSPDVRWEIPQTIDTIDPALVALQSEVGLREDTAARWQNMGRSCPAQRAIERQCAANTAPARARQRRDGLPDLSHLLGDKLFRLSFADEGKPAGAAK